MRRALLLAAIVVIAAVTPAVARGSVVTEVGGELAKQGAKAAIAQLAPGLNKHLDATSAQLQEISGQIAKLDEKLNELKAYTASVGLQLECVNNVSHLNTILGSADAHLRTLTFAASATGIQRTEQLDALARDAVLMRSQQSELNHALLGPLGLINSCARKIEFRFGDGRFITSKIRPDVEAFYAAYRAAHISLLTAQVNAATYVAEKAGKPDDPSTARLVETLVREVEGYVASEEREIKPSIPAEFSYDKAYDILMKVQPIAGTGRDALAKPLLAAGWWVTGFTTVPTCSAVQNTIGRFGAAALRSWAVINFPADGNIQCYDDSDVLHLFNVNTFTYTRPAIKHAFTMIVVPALIWRPNKGYINPKEYSYLLTK